MSKINCTVCNGPIHVDLYAVGDRIFDGCDVAIEIHNNDLTIPAFKNDDYFIQFNEKFWTDEVKKCCNNQEDIFFCPKCNSYFTIDSNYKPTVVWRN